MPPIRARSLREADAAGRSARDRLGHDRARWCDLHRLAGRRDGAGHLHGLAAVLADELDADWSKVTIAYPPVWDEKSYGNPQFGGSIQTSASMATRGYFKPMRIAGAQARRVLLDAVAARWNVPVGELSTEPSVVVHKASNRRIGYGEIAGFARVPAELPKIDDKDLKPNGELPLHRQGCAAHRGAAQGHRRRQVRHGCARCPVWSMRRCCMCPIRAARRRRVDDAAARQVPGITDVVRLPDGVGVIGTTVEATQAAKNLLKVTWSNAPAGDL